MSNDLNAIKSIRALDKTRRDGQSMPLSRQIHYWRRSSPFVAELTNSNLMLSPTPAKDLYVHISPDEIV
jgi:hypothetical protein